MRARTLPSPRGLSLEYQPRNTCAEPERYRSGHNGADSKSDGRVIPARGFESHPLRHDFLGGFNDLSCDLPPRALAGGKLVANSGDKRGRALSKISPALIT